MRPALSRPAFIGTKQCAPVLIKKGSFLLYSASGTNAGEREPVIVSLDRVLLSGCVRIVDVKRPVHHIVGDEATTFKAMQMSQYCGHDARSRSLRTGT